MSFGFSVSDIYGCACLAYRLYDEFKQAPGACKEFARELLLFHQVLLRTKSSLEYGTSHLSHSDQAALEACLDSCKELLYVQISGAPKVPENLDMIKFSTQDLRKNDFSHPSSDHARFLRGLRQKVRERNFALRIPKFQRAISAHVQKLNALSVLIIQYLYPESSPPYLAADRCPSQVVPNWDSSHSGAHSTIRRRVSRPLGNIIDRLRGPA